MKNKISAILLFLVLFLPFGCESVKPADKTANPVISGEKNNTTYAAEQVFGQISDMIRKTSASVVKVTVEFSVIENGKKQDYEANGTGFFVSANNKTYILVFSAGHLVQNKGRYEAYRMDLNTGEETIFPLTLSAFDEDLDFSVFSFNPKKLNFKPQPLLLADSFAPAEKIFAIGAPDGLYLNYTEGLISRVFPLKKEDGGLDGDYILHSAAISPGNSGGPLVNLRGEVVGINLAMHQPSQNYQQISWARPVSLIKKFLLTIPNKK